MLSLFTHDDYAALGLATVLDIERIPYRRIERLEQHDQPLLVAVGGGLSAREADVLAGQPSLVFNGGPLFTARLLGARGVVDDTAVAVPLTEPIWPPALRGRAGDVGALALRLPGAPLCCVVGRHRGEIVTQMRAHDDGRSLPAVVRVGDCLWSSVDLGTTFANLLCERWLPNTARHGIAAPPWARHVAERLYYAAPARLRQALQASTYRRLERRLQTDNGCASAYPVDATGWLLIELVRALLTRAAGSLVRIAHWPGGRAAAAVLTHDLEPRRYAYTDGLQRLLARLPDDTPPSAFGVVAKAGTRYLTGAPRAAIAAREVYCHGLDHRGEPVQGRAQLAERLRRARTHLERHLGRPLRGYRSPRLERSPDLDWALDAAGFTYDSSRPDVDRENLTHYGGGVRLNLPYRAPIQDADGRWRRSRCLELPLTAPDCIQPLFAGQDTAALRAAVARKAAFVRASGGLYVALVHAGVFGADDATRREDHLRFVAAQLEHRDTWFTGVAEVVDWWRAREHLQVSVTDGIITVRNEGRTPVSDAALIIDSEDASVTVPLPRLAPGEVFTTRRPVLNTPPPAPSPALLAGEGGGEGTAVAWPGGSLQGPSPSGPPGEAR